MLNYNNRTVEPILTAITEGMTRAFITKTARTQGHSVEYFRSPFKLVPISQLAEIADKLTRNEIASSNEFRQIIGFKPRLDDPKADQLRNSNMPQSELGVAPAGAPLQVSSERADQAPDFSEMDQVVNDMLDGLNDDIDKLTQDIV
jgi:hypothetical protein